MELYKTDSKRETGDRKRKIQWKSRVRQTKRRRRRILRNRDKRDIYRETD